MSKQIKDDELTLDDYCERFARKRDYETAIHEAGHAVVAHLTGTAIDHVTITPKGYQGRLLNAGA